jgi:hypothetical protein
MNREILNFDDYPYILHAKEKDIIGGYTQVFNNFFNFVFSPTDPEWGRNAEIILRTRYNSVILNNTFYFKTESDKTLFLLRFS